MSRRSTWVLAVAALTAALLAAAPAAADDTGGGQKPQNSAVIEIPYGGPGELRVADGVRIDCGALPPVDGVDVACEPEGLVLEVAQYAPGWGERVLPVTLQTGATRSVVSYRVVLAPPPAPQVTRTRIDHPFTAGAQALVPLSMLGIDCALCGAASVNVDAVTPASASAGVGATHLAVRSAVPGDVVVALRIVDDAGQEAAAEVTVSMAGGGDAAPGAPGALHVSTAPTRDVDLTAYAWGDGLTFSCSAADATPTAPACTPDGRASLAAMPAAGDQFAFRVVAADGRQALGSVTFADPAAGGTVAVPIAPVWDDTAPLGIRVAAPPADTGAVEGATVLSRLSRILQEVPAP